MRSLTKEELLGELKLKSETVEIGDGYVNVSEVSAVDYITLWTECSEETGEKDAKGNVITTVNMSKFIPRLVAFSVTDEAGNRMFGDEEISAFERAAQGPFSKIAEVAKRLNGLGVEKNVETLIQDSETSGESQLLLDLDTPTI